MSHLGGPIIGLLFLTPCWHFARRRPGPESRALRWHGVFLFVFLATMPMANAHAIDAFVRVAGAGRLVVELAGLAAWLSQYRFIALAQNKWGHRSRRLVYGCCAAVVVLVLFWIGAHVVGSSDAASYYNGYQVRSWPLTGLNLTSGLVTALLGALVMVRWAIAWRHAAGLIERYLSLGVTLFYAAIFGYGLVMILTETIVRLVWGTDAGFLAYRQPLYTVLVVGSLVSLWFTQYSQRCKSWLSERIGRERWRRAAKRAAVLLCDRLVLLYGDGAVVDNMARHLVACHVGGYWRLVGEEVARWLSFAPTGRVGMRPHQDIIDADHKDANGRDGDPKMIEAQYYANTYDAVAAITTMPRRPHISAGEKAREIAPVALARLVREGLSPSPIRKTVAVEATWRHGSGMSDTLSWLIRLHRSLLAANEYVTGEMVRLYGDLETVACVDRRLDSERMGSYRRAVALEATRWIILTRVGLAAKLAIEAKVPLSVVGLAAGIEPSLALDVGRLRLERSRFYRDVYRVAVLADAERLPDGVAALPGYHGWRAHVANLINGELPPFLAEEQILVEVQRMGAMGVAAGE
jgi:hypothetical protein